MKTKKEVHFKIDSRWFLVISLLLSTLKLLNVLNVSWRFCILPLVPLIFMWLIAWYCKLLVKKLKLNKE